jgi:hypothetical protein
MPISNSEFESRKRNPTLLLLDFLSLNNRNAYTLDELEAVVKSIHEDLNKEDVESLLNALEYGGKLRSRTIDGKIYYRYSSVAGMKLI